MKVARSQRPAFTVHTYRDVTIAEAAVGRGRKAMTLCGLTAIGRVMRVRKAFLEERLRKRCPRCVIHAELGDQAR